MRLDEAKAVWNMATVRVIGAVLEIAAAIAMVRFGTVAASLKVNALLGLLGPAVLLAVSALGLVGIAVQVSPMKVALVALGVCLFWYGAR